MRIGIKAMLKVRFGDEGIKLMPEIREIHEENILEAVIEALQTATSPEELCRLWKPENA